MEAKVAIAAIALRAILGLVGIVQDAVSVVKYTDIDYFVFTDAAQLVRRGQSPYLRATYRYTPLLALLLSVTNGKLLFAACDLFAAILIARINRLAFKHSHTECNKNIEAALWALNPFVAVISTRGNAESVIAALVLATVYLLMRKQTIAAALAFGLAVHMKVYAIIYALPFWLYIDHTPSTPKSQITPQPTRSRSKSRSRAGSSRRSTSRKRKSKSSQSTQFATTTQQRKNVKQDKPTLLHRLTSFFTPTRLLFGITSASLFFALGLFCYALYGHDFLQHTYLYHITRQDHRHNFSPYFYSLYLSSTASTSAATSSIAGLLAFAPQLLVSSFVGAAAVVAGNGDIVYALFAQTFVFVALNKVVTSQYFMWFLAFAPIVLQKSRLVVGTTSWEGVGLIGVWVLGQALWLWNAYRLEHLGINTFRELHFAGLFFEVVNAFILVRLTKAHIFPAASHDKKEG